VPERERWPRVAVGHLRAAFQHRSFQPDCFRERRDAVCAVRLAAIDAETDIVADTQMRKQRAVLRDHPDAPLVGRYRLPVIDYGLAIERDRAAIGRIEAGDQTEQRGLSRSRRPDDRRAASLLDIEVDAGKRGHTSEAPFERPDAEIGHRPAILFD
jgi:hypothetical protein